MWDVDTGFLGAAATIHTIIFTVGIKGGDFEVMLACHASVFGRIPVLQRCGRAV
jgi:hypothetical protein